MKFFLIFIITLVIGIVLFYNLSPNLGAKIKNEDFENIENFFSGKFHNIHSIPFKISQAQIEADSDWFMKMLKPLPDREPTNPVKINKLNIEDFENAPDDSLVWFGHSGFMLKEEGKTFLFDPVFSLRPSPVPFLIKERYNKELVLDPEDFPLVDVLLISHDHYDHLDYDTIINIKDKVKQFIVPIGVDQHLIHWGVKKEKITILKWWDHVMIDNVKISLTPAQHFSGRKLNQNNTLWGGYMLSYSEKQIYFSGDSGYGSHFKEIKKRFGKIDFALLESGQYNANWADIHMLPEQTVQAAEDLEVEVFMPVHWGMFTLSTHSWTDPVNQLSKHLKNKNIDLFTPEVGKIVNIKENMNEEWWKNN